MGRAATAESSAASNLRRMRVRVLKWTVAVAFLLLDLLAILVLLVAVNDPGSPVAIVWGSLWLSLVAGAIWVALFLHLTAALRGVAAVQMAVVTLIGATGFVGYYAVKNAPARTASVHGGASDATTAERSIAARIAAAEAKLRQLMAARRLTGEDDRRMRREARALRSAVPIEVDGETSITAVRYAEGVMYIDFTIDRALTAAERNVMGQVMGASAKQAIAPECDRLGPLLRRGLILQYDYITQAGAPVAKVVLGPGACGGRV